MYNEIPFVVLLLALSACGGTQGGSDYAGAAKPSCQKLTTQAEINGKTEPVTGVACQQSDGTWQFMQNTDRPYYGYPYSYYYDPWYWGPFGFGADFVFIDRDHHHHHFNHGSTMHQSVAAGAGFHGHGMGGGMHH